MRLRFILPLILLIFAGCGRIPEPTGYDYSVQQKMQAAHHWDVLAIDIANQINNELILNDYGERPVFVKETCGDDSTSCLANQTSPFNESFRDLLITRLVAFGVPTSTVETDETVTINYKTQLVYHSATRTRTVQPGALTALTAGVMVMRNAPTELIALAVAGVLDFANASVNMKSKYEVIVTTSIVDSETYIFRQSNIYYIQDKDFWHYQQNYQKAATIALSNSYFQQGPTQQSNLSMVEELPEEIPMDIEPELEMEDEENVFEPIPILPEEDLPAGKSSKTDI